MTTNRLETYFTPRTDTQSTNAHNNFKSKQVDRIAKDTLSKATSNLKRGREDSPPLSPPRAPSSSVKDLFGVAFPKSPRRDIPISSPAAPKKRQTQLSLFASFKENDDLEPVSPCTPSTPRVPRGKNSASPSEEGFLKRKTRAPVQEALAPAEVEAPSVAFLKRQKGAVSFAGATSPEARPNNRIPRTLSPFETQNNALTLNQFKLADQRECKVSYLAKGTFSNVYTLEDNQNPIISGIDNSALVLKAFHGENTGFNEHKLRGYLVNIIDNYNHCKSLGLPVAEIYNADTAVQHGYILQQRVDGKMDPLNESHRVQVQQFFNASVSEKLVMDLLPDNFKVLNGKVVLIDFVEDSEEPDFGADSASEVAIFNKRVCDGWFSLFKKLEMSNDQAATFTNELSGNHYEDHIKDLVKATEFNPTAMIAPQDLLSSF